jgi:hypothetical protein
MHRPLRPLAFLVALALLVGATAGAAGASAPVKANPAAWAKSVCTGVSTWLSKIEGAAAAAAASAPAKPKAAKKSLLKVVDGAIAATKQLVARLKQAGAPSVSGGADLAKTVVQQYQQVQITFNTAKSDLSKAKVKDAATLVAAIRPAEDALESALEHVQAAFNAATTLDVQPLVKAFNNESSCKSIVAAV